ncbi:MAG: TIGR03808 family TAT-translocated repetitive protein [Hyphomicrobiaceae bacterium]
MAVNRRGILAAGFGLGGAGLSGMASARAGGPEASPPAARLTPDPARAMTSTDAGLAADTAIDQSARLQAAFDAAAERRVPLLLAPGRYMAGGLMLRPGLTVSGNGGAATLALARPGAPLLAGERADDIALHDIALDGGMLAIGGEANALVALDRCSNISFRRLDLTSSGGRGLALKACGGRLERSRFAVIAEAALFAIDSTGLDITDNAISDCGNNGIQVWRSSEGEDGSTITHNRIARIDARAGGHGEHGNGINVFRAGSVLVDGNRITDCAYSAVRGNTASNIQILSNSCQRIGEVALYAEFGFEGAVIAGNIVDDAAAGISVTNFDVGGRLAVVQGNLVRNLKRREHEQTDKRGEGISVEADASVTGNTIENAPSAGIVIGWGRHMRDVIATGNLIRDARVGIAVSSDAAAGACLITANMISRTREGAIRAMDLGRLHGPDLAREAVATSGRVIIENNMAV